MNRLPLPLGPPNALSHPVVVRALYPVVRNSAEIVRRYVIGAEDLALIRMK